MKNDLENSSLVIVGRWNPAILSPEWLSEEVFDKQPIKILFPVVGGFPPLFEIHDTRVLVTNDRVVFAPLKDGNDVLDEIESAARHILATLPHTPIIAFGENFSYTVDDFPEQVAGIIKLSDEVRLCEYGRVGSVWLGRTIEMQNCRLNLTITSGQPNRVAVNFHYDVAKATTAAELMTTTYTANRDLGLKILGSVYDLTLDEKEKQ